MSLRFALKITIISSACVSLVLFFSTISSIPSDLDIHFQLVAPDVANTDYSSENVIHSGLSEPESPNQTQKPKPASGPHSKPRILIDDSGHLPGTVNLPSFPMQNDSNYQYFSAEEVAELMPSPAISAIPEPSFLCDATIEREANEEHPWRQRWGLLERDGVWPSSGPDAGGGMVLILPRTAAARREGLSCRFGKSVRSAGYSAFSGLVSCTAPPRAHIIRPGDTLRAIADRHGQTVPDILALNPALRGREAALAVGEELALQPPEVAVALLAPDGREPPGEREGMRYRYFPLRVDAVHPRSAPTEGGVVITLSGAGFRPFGVLGGADGRAGGRLVADGGQEKAGGGAGSPCPVRCRFGSRMEVAAAVVSDRELRCVAPPLPTAELEEGDPGSTGLVVRSVAVEVTVNGADFTRAGRRLTYRRRLLCVPPPLPPPAGGGGQPAPAPILLVAVPKAFEGEAAAAQWAAARSWLALRPRPRILLAGRDAGVAAAAAALGAEHAPGVRLSPDGTPLLDSVLEEAEARAGPAAAGWLILFVNADIVLSDDLPLVARWAAEALGPALVVGRRTNTNATLAERLSAAAALGGDGGRQALLGLRRLARGGGGWAAEHSRWALDYFAFTPGLWRAAAGGGRRGRRAAPARHPNATSPTGLPPFAVGRPGYDNWLVRRAVELGWPVVDASAMVVALHPPHSRSHARAAPAAPVADGGEWARAVRGGGAAPARDVWETMRSAEIARNLALAGPGAKLGTADHATWVALPCLA